MRPSPARAAAPDPAVWLPITDLGDVIELEVELWADELGLTSSDSALSNASTTGNVTLVPAPAPLEAPEPPELEAAPELTPVPSPADETGLWRTQGTDTAAFREREPARTKIRTRPAAPARPKLAQAVVLTAAAAAVAVGALMLMGPKQHEVTVELDGRSVTRTTDARTVGGFLREQHVVLGALDRVVPGLGSSLDDGTVVRIERKGAAPRAGKSAVEIAPVSAAGAATTAVPAAPPIPAAPAAPPDRAATVAVDTPTPPTTASSPTSSAPRFTGRRPAPPAARSLNGSADGGASWYASPFGPDSCASRTLKFGTIVTITNVGTGATTTCRVADRGPVARSRVLDLDNDVFRRLAPLGTGVISVHITW